MLRIGGSVIASPISPSLINNYAELLINLKAQKHDIVVVTGGGTLAREFIQIAKELDLEIHAQDEIAISVLELFAQVFLKKLAKLACDKVAISLDEVESCLETRKIAFLGGLKPGITTDAVAALVAEHIGADLLLKGTDQDGIYDKDPRKFSDATKLDFIKFNDLEKFLAEKTHKAGIHQIIDPEAIKILKRNRVKLVVVNGFKPENLLAAVKGERVGTTVD